MWLARDKDGSLALYDEKPLRYDYTFYNDDEEYIILDSETFPEVTWENSPQEVELKIKTT